MGFTAKAQVYNAAIQETVLGVGDKALTLGGAKTQPLCSFDEAWKNAPAVGVEVSDIPFETEGFPMTLISKKYPIDNGGSKLFTFHSSLLPSKWHIDLPECNRLQLMEAGIPEHQISVSPVCTFQQFDTFFSARRLGIDSGRIFTGIILRRRD